MGCSVVALKRKRRRERVPAAFLGYLTKDPGQAPARPDPTGRAQVPAAAEEAVAAVVAAEPGTLPQRQSPIRPGRSALPEAEEQAAEAAEVEVGDCHRT